MILIIAGGLGFFVLQELKRAAKNLLKKERTKFSLHTKLVGLITSSVIIFGAVSGIFNRKWSWIFRSAP